MTNITLSIDDKVYKKMKKHSEIKWSEFVRRIIQKRVEQLENLDSTDNFSDLLLASQESMKELWDNEYDEVWNNV